MPKFHPLTISEVRRETADTVSIAFDVPAHLQAEYQYTQGQYLTLRATIDGEDTRRSYSICSSPLDGELRVAIKQVPQGRFSTYANQVLQAGDTLQVMTPMGRFYTEVAPTQRKRYAAFAAGSGITPILSIMKTVLATEPQSEFFLFYGNQRTDTIIFKEAIDALKNTHLQRLSVYHVLSREALGSPLFEGRIDAPRTEKFCQLLIDPTHIDEYFLCGPEEMIFAVKDTLAAHHVDPKRVHFELFTSASSKAAPAPKPATTDAPTQDQHQVTIILDGHSYRFPLAPDGPYILDAALAAGADLPFACKGGVCCTCRAKVEQGDVTMDLNYALEDWEVQQGFVLTCQARPQSSDVVVNFDEQ